MVDIHSHILPGLDDGSKSLEESIAMVETAKQSGTTDIVATPHANSQYTFDPQKIAEHASALTAAVPGIKIHTGCDFHLSFENIQDALQDPSKYTINHKQYLLVEFPDMVTFTTTPQIFAELRSRGMVPIVTHPERNLFLQERTKDLEAWVREGCYVQITALSFLGTFGKKARDSANDMMKHGLVHFVASDAHDLSYRTTSLKEAFDYVADRFGRDRAEQVFIYNPRAVIEGDEILPMQPAEPPKRRFRFWG